MANNNGYGDTAGRLNCSGGATGTQRHRPSDPTGDPFARDVKNVLRAETRAGQFRKGGLGQVRAAHEQRRPASLPSDLPQAYARGGNADTHLSADYPGGTTA